MQNKLSRRRFLQSAAVAGGAVAVGVHIATSGRGADADQWGDLVGRFVYDGTPAERKKLVVDKDVECCGKFDIRDETLMVAEDGGVGNLFVYLRTKGAPIAPGLEENVAERVVLDNRDCIFIPHCMTIWHTKQEFHIVNSDPVAQNVAFTPLGDRPANIVLAVGGDATWKFNRQQNFPVPIKCNYHPWESAYLLPRDNPYMTVSQADGKFRISKLPVGEKLEFQVWHERVGYFKTPDWERGRFELEVAAGETDLGTITCEPDWFVKS
jgi:hypothetical protein